MGTIHSEMSGLELHEAFHFVQESDPGAVGAKKYWLKVSTGTLKRRNDSNSGWIAIGDSGITEFTQLTDAPNTYVGSALKAVRVNAGGTALEFYTPSAASLPFWVTNSPDTAPGSADAMDDEFEANSLDAKWTWNNQGSTTVTTSGNGIANFNVDTTGSRSIRCLTQPTPSGTWEIITKCTPIWIPNSTTAGTTGGGYNVAYNCGGLALRDSGSSKLIVMYIVFDTFLRCYVQTMTNSTTFNSTPYFYDALKPQQWYWLKIKKTASKYQFFVSHDGLVYNQFGEETIGSFLTADQIGLTMDAVSGAAFRFDVDYFRRIA